MVKDWTFRLLSGEKRWGGSNGKRWGGSNRKPGVEATLFARC